MAKSRYVGIAAAIVVCAALFLVGGHFVTRVALPRVADFCYQAGGVSHSREEYGLALRLYEVAGWLAPRRPWVHFGKAITFDGLGRYEDAVASYDRFLEYYPGHPIACVGKGEALMHIGESERALEYFDEALARTPGSAWAHYRKGKALLKLGRYEEAAQHLGLAAEMDPTYAYAHYTEGRAYYSLGEYTKALACFDEATELEPDYAQFWDFKGVTLELLGEYEEALEAFNVAIAADPDFAVPVRNEAMLLYVWGRYDEAAKLFDRALSLDPDDETAWLYKGMFLLARGDGAGGLMCMDRALALDPKDKDAWRIKGIALYMEGRYEEALVAAGEFTELNRGDEGYLLSYVFASAAGEDGMEYLPSIIDGYPKTGTANIALFITGEITERQLFSSVGNGANERCTVHFYVGYEYKLDGDLRGARRHFEAAAATEARRTGAFILAEHELRVLNAGVKPPNV
jgi:tetratricopeptide (TPR) repeat protein